MSDNDQGSANGSDRPAPERRMGDRRSKDRRRSGVTAEDAAEVLELRQLADETAVAAQSYLDVLTEVASGSSPDTAIPVLLLAVSQILLDGARLGAIRDVVPIRRFEPDTGLDPDIDPLRAGLANLLEGLDVYADIVDPLTSAQMVRGSLSDDLVHVAADLVHGLRHYRLGRIDEALWWWQFSYLSTWGVRAASALRVLQSMLGHLRLDVDAETVADAEFDALHTP